MNKAKKFWDMGRLWVVGGGGKTKEVRDKGAGRETDWETWFSWLLHPDGLIVECGYLGGRWGRHSEWESVCSFSA